MKDNSFIKLKNVSKFYYSKGVIASGFSKINLSFKMGEFVAITGESGSGKSTLLNVISGLDSYEEGEMYIDGKETSHYTEKDFEDYRRRYIGNIFQNFNLVNSYTVYQNIELVLLLNGNSKRKIKKDILELIKKVGLYKFRNTKVSKLSGGQKQRVAIARALAKDTPIIIADEPTGNLDSKSAKEIIKLLSEIAKNKLVIIVTHNYEQVEEYITRKIKMHDGKILEDKELKKVKVTDNSDASYKNITFFNRIRLGFRNTFNVLPKFLLVMLVYLFLSLSIISTYAQLKEEASDVANYGYNYIFNDTDPSRIIIKKEDNSAFTDEDYEKISKVDNVKTVFKNDLLLDNEVYLSDNYNLWIYGRGSSIDIFEGELDYGRMPENEYEVIVETDQYYIDDPESVLDAKLYLSDGFSGNNIGEYTVVGLKKLPNNIETFAYFSNTRIYLSNKALEDLTIGTNRYFSDTYVTFAGSRHLESVYDTYGNILPDAKVARGIACVSEDFKYLYNDEKWYGNNIDIVVNNIYFNTNKTIKMKTLYSKKNYKNVLSTTEEFEFINGTIYINPEDYKELYGTDLYQISVFVKDKYKAQETAKKIAKLGYTTLSMKDTFTEDLSSKIVRVFNAALMIVLIVTVFFICYFVLNIILKSRNTYYATIRMLGASSRISNQLLSIELLIDSTISFFIIILGAYILRDLETSVSFIESINRYLVIKDYLLLFAIVSLISFFISKKYAKKMFKKSAMTTMREGGL